MKFKRLLSILLVLLILLTACGKKTAEPAGTTSNTDAVVTQETTAKTSEKETETEPQTQTQAETEAETETESETQAPTDVPDETEPPIADEPSVRDDLPVYGEYYYDVENVVLYLVLYDELPPNYITKNEARALGWEGGSVEKYKDGAAIGGDRFGNYEGQLPKAKGRSYTECDIDTDGYSSRGSRRLVFSSDGLYFYTSDHYENFKEVTVTEDYEVIW